MLESDNKLTNISTYPVRKQSCITEIVSLGNRRQVCLLFNIVKKVSSSRVKVRQVYLFLIIKDLGSQAQGSSAVRLIHYVCIIYLVLNTLPPKNFRVKIN